MPINSTADRSDIVYLKRRPKMGESPRATALSGSSFNLDLSNNAVVSTNSSLRLNSPTEAETLVPAKPELSGRVVLDLVENPVIRLNARQSAIGSLEILNANSFAWDTGTFSGVETVSEHSSVMPVFANRKLIEFYKGEIIVGLRHFHALKRVIVSTNSGIMEIKLYDGSSLIVDSNNGANVVYISRIKNILEVRVEKLIGSVMETFSVTKSL